jgi:hypothetical protein
MKYHAKRELDFFRTLQVRRELTGTTCRWPLGLQRACPDRHRRHLCVAVLRRIYMRFLYRRLPIPLENIWNKWHLIGAPSVTERPLPS